MLTNEQIKAVYFAYLKGIITEEECVAKLTDLVAKHGIFEFTSVLIEP